jgi:SET domain-containing protein
MRVVADHGQPYLCLFATTDIVPGTELLYNYGDREENMWWRKRKQVS